MECWYITSKGEQYHLKVTAQVQEDIDALLDQANRIKPTYITREEFDYADTVTMEVRDPNRKYKIGEVTFKSPCLMRIKFLDNKKARKDFSPQALK